MIALVLILCIKLSMGLKYHYDPIDISINPSSISCPDPYSFDDLITTEDSENGSPFSELCGTFSLNADADFLYLCCMTEDYGYLPMYMNDSLPFVNIGRYHSKKVSRKLQENCPQISPTASPTLAPTGLTARPTTSPTTSSPTLAPTNSPTTPAPTIRYIYESEKSIYENMAWGLGGVVCGIVIFMIGSCAFDYYYENNGDYGGGFVSETEMI